MTDLQEIVGEDVNVAEPDAQAAPEQAPEQVAHPESVAEGEQRSEEAQSKVVPLAALHEERTRRKELAAEILQMKQSQAQRDQLIERRLEAMQRASEPPPPTFEQDPAGHLQQNLQRVEMVAQQANEQMSQFRQQAEAQRMIGQAASAVTMAEAQQLAARPDYHDAVNFIRDSRARELMAYGNPQDVAAQMAVQEIREFALDKAMRGMNPAELAYKLAEARGYTAKAQAPDAGQRMATQQRGVAASKSLGSGGAAGVRIGVEALATMSDEDFAEATKGSKWSKMFGG